MKNRLQDMGYGIFLIIIGIICILPTSGNAQIMTVNGNTEIYLRTGSILSVKGGLKLSSGSSIVHENTGISNLYISGKFNYLGTYTQNSYGILRFFGSLQDTVTGNNLDVARLWILKSGSGMLWLNIGTDMLIRNELRLVSNNLFNINKSKLTIDSTAMIYPDSTSNYTADPLIDPFTDSKHITSSGDSATTGRLVRRIKWAASLAVDLSVRFPIGTVNDTTNPTARYYTPARYVFNAGEAAFGKGAYISTQVIAAEHYATEVKQVALKKYWRITSDSVKANVGGYNIRFNYNQNDVQGFEEYYLLCLFYRPNDSTYYINRGSGYGIEPINNRFYVDEVNKKDTLGGTRLLLDGEWSAGQEEAVSTFYYSRADGDWFSPSTWSKQQYNGAPASTIPSNLNDKVFIGNGRTVTLATSSAEINKTTIDSTGRLKITGFNAKLQGDSLFVKDGGTLAVSSPDGLYTSGILGNIQTTKIRSYSTRGKYEFIGGTNQVTGPGIPDIVSSIIIDKDFIDDTVSLSKSILIKDSLVINQGAFHVFKQGNFTSNGETGDTTNRSIIMRGGEFILQNFPTNFKNGNFNAGTITFEGSSSFRLPSSASPSPGEPSVTQYYNVNFKGARGANTVITLDPTGEIRIGGKLDISALSFNPTPLSDRFLVTGSRVVFNGNGNQEIQTGYPTPVGINYRLKFHDLVIDGSGIKNIMNPNDVNSADNHVLVRSLVYIKQGTLKTNNYWIKDLGNWTAETGSTFDGGTGLVTFEADGKVTNIKSNGTTFYNLRIMGTLANGYVNYVDSLNIAGNLEINPNSLRCLNSASLAVQGNWYNKGAFVANTGRVYFNGSVDQKLDHNGLGTFYNLSVNKSAGMVRINGDSLIKITNDLTLQKGNIGGRISDSVVNKPLIVDGTITRPGGTPGHVDGRLRLPSVEGVNSIFFAVGLDNDYAPMKLDINGTGGRAGYLDGYVLLDTTAPNLGRAIIVSQVANGPELDSTKNVRKVWVLNADSTLAVNQRFLLQPPARTYDLEFFFPVTDKRNGANSDNFLIAQRDTTTNSARWSLPFVSNTNPLSTKTTGNTNFKNYSPNYFIVGEPQTFTYYSIANGRFKDTTTWSIFGYQSTEAALRKPGPNDHIRIGNGKTVTFDSSYSINNGRIFRVETGGTGYQNGHLQFTSDTSHIWGAGTFRLDSGAALTIVETNGISTQGNNTGCIRVTGKRYYNGDTTISSAHNRGNFIYARNGAQVTGNGLPASMQTLKVNLGSGTLTFTTANSRVQVWDSLYFAGGTTDISNITMKLSGNFRVGATATFNPGNTALGSGGLSGVDTTTNAGFIFNGSNVQYIEKEGSLDSIYFYRFGLAKQGGVVVAKSRLGSNQFIFHDVNRARVDVQTYNKYFQTTGTTAPTIFRKGATTDDANTNDPTYLSDSKWGWIAGRLIRAVPNSGGHERVYPIGTNVRYTPVHINPNNSTTTSADFIEIQAVEGNHPNFNSSQINQNTNIQRYYEITRTVNPASTFTLGGNTIQIGLIFTQDEPRGGIDPTTYSVFRLNSSLSWERATNISKLNTGSYTSTATQASSTANSPNALTGNTIFAVTSQFSAAQSLTLMIGEPAGGADRIFYAKNSGNWKNPNTWANESSNILYENTETGYALSGNASGTFPKSSTTTRDYAIIGNGVTVTCDTSNFDLQYVLLEKSANGIGTLIMPGENYLKTDQFVQKNGGKLSIGSANGIVGNSTTTGNIRQLTSNSIINFDWNSLGINNYAYIGTTAQVTGSGLPTRVGSLEINYTGGSGYVDLSKDSALTIKDSLIFNNGTLRNFNGNKTIALKGDLITNTNGSGINSGSNRALILDSTKNQQIRGNADSTVLWSTLTINKPSGSLSALKNVRLNSKFDVLSNTLFSLADNRTLTFGDTATINNIDSFNVNRMIKVSGGLNTAKLRKTYPTGTNLSPSFRFPVGEDSSGQRTARFGEAKFDLNNMDFANGNYLEFFLRSQYPHPSLTGSPNILKKYWSVYCSGITLNTGGNVNTRFKYNDPEVVGNILSYNPAIYRRATLPTSLDPGWSSTIFNPTSLSIDTTNKYIIVTGAKTLPYYDWTAANPSAFSKGKVYWSRSTGNWNDGNTWTNITSSGNHNSGNEPALNYPGFYPNDTVYIGNNHIVTYLNNVNYPLDSIGIGITTPSTSPELHLGTAASSNKALKIAGSLMVGATGLLTKDNTPSVTSIDTLYIIRDLSNIGGAGRGVAIHPNVSRNVRLVFNGSDSTRILGEGVYGSIGNVEILKTDSVWNTINKSASFSSAFSNAVLTIPTVNFDLNAGMYVHDVNSNITLSTNGDGNVFLGDLVGLVVRAGNIIFSDGLICGQNASVWLANGTMTIGNAVDENFQYESVTIIDIAGTSRLKVAGTLRRRFTTSSVDFRLKDNAQIEVMMNGATTNSSERRAAFDFGEANSKFTMTGNSKVIIYRPMGLSVALEKDPDYLVSASTDTVTGGTVQFGDPALNYTGEPFTLIASVPFWNLDLAKTYGKDLFVGSPIVTVRNNFLIRDSSRFNQNGNNLNIGGDFTIDGLYKTGTLGTRRVSFFGDTSASPATKRTQTLSIKNNTNDNFYDIVINKSDSGTVVLSNSVSYPYSNIILSNTLEFSVGNRGLINTGNSRYVQVGTNTSDLASIQRFGNGHVNGYLRRWINNGPQDRMFYVGTDKYTPARLETTSGTGTAGLVSVRAYDVAHPDIANASDMQPGTNIDRYWQILPLGSTPFVLGSGRTFTLTLYFIKGNTPTGDVKPGSTYGIFEHFRRTAEYPNTGTWFTTVPLIRTDSSTSTNLNDAFGDFIIGEIAGQRFFSSQDGDWNEQLTWRTGSYTGALASRAPTLETDRVFIGNGNTVTIRNSSPKVRSTTVEMYNNLPGKLVILDERYLRGLSFILNDSCFTATDDAFGYTSVNGATPNIGAIRTTSIRSYGKGTYEFVGTQAQAIGDGPVAPKTILVNNSGFTNNSVSFSPFIYNIEDTILVKDGRLLMGTGLVNLKGNFIVNQGTNVGPDYATLNLNGTNGQNFVMNDTSGIELYNLKLSKTSGTLILGGTADSARLKINRNLEFAATNTSCINTRINNKYVMLTKDTTTITRTGLGHVDGYLLKQFPSGASNFKYEIGFGNQYMPATLNISSGSGISGLVVGYVNSPPSINLPRINPTKRINYYWALSPWTNFGLGTRTATTKFQFPAADMSNFTGGIPNSAFLFRKSIPAENPLWTNRNYSQTTWNTLTATVENNLANSWTGLGEFYISEKFFPTFYSRQNGNWNDHNTWTLSPTHIGASVDPGEFPNSDLLEKEDNVYIGLNHIVTLNVTEPQIDTLVIRNSSKLDMNINAVNCADCTPVKGLFSLRDSATITFGSTINPSSSINMKNFLLYNMGINSTVEFSGTQSITPTPFSPLLFSNYPGNIKISGLGIKTIDANVIVNGNLYIDLGSSLTIGNGINPITLSVKGSVINQANIFNNQGVLEVGVSP